MKNHIPFRGRRRSPRTVHFATKVTAEFDNLIRTQAARGNLLLVEMLEKYQAAYREQLERTAPVLKKKKTKH